MSAPAFRVVYPAASAGQKHAGYLGRIYVTFPGERERELPGVSSVVTRSDAGGPFEILVSFYGSCVIEYEGGDA
jgi:hypothetical protein